MDEFNKSQIALSILATVEDTSQETYDLRLKAIEALSTILNNEGEK